MTTSANICADCPIGFYCEDFNTINPVICPTGSYCPINSILPIQCPPGTFNSLTGKGVLADCVPCTGMYACPDFGMSAVGA